MTQLRKALKTSEICMTKPENLYLLVKILNAYLFFYNGPENNFVSAQDINDLLSFIKETIDEIYKYFFSQMDDRAQNLNKKLQ